jgi:predicted O-methyltransferase YrrM
LAKTFAQTNGIDPQSITGFLLPEEGEALASAAKGCGALGPILEIGSYCGRSALYLGPAARKAGTILYALDHHRGSEENQPGWEWHDPQFWDEEAGALDTLTTFRRNLHKAGLEDCVTALVGPSITIARHWTAPLGMVFIDGGHTMKAAMGDYRGWASKVLPGGILAIHDVFPNPDDGGRPPFEVYQMALKSGLFEQISLVHSLALLRRLG